MDQVGRKCFKRFPLPNLTSSRNAPSKIFLLFKIIQCGRSNHLHQGATKTALFLWNDFLNLCLILLKLRECFAHNFYNNIYQSAGRYQVILKQSLDNNARLYLFFVKKCEKQEKLTHWKNLPELSTLLAHNEQLFLTFYAKHILALHYLHSKSKSLKRV